MRLIRDQSPDDYSSSWPLASLGHSARSFARWPSYSFTLQFSRQRTSSWQLASSWVSTLCTCWSSSNLLHQLHANHLSLGSDEVKDGLSTQHSPGVCLRSRQHVLRRGTRHPASPRRLGLAHPHPEEDYREYHVEFWIDVCVLLRL